MGAFSSGYIVFEGSRCGGCGSSIVSLELILLIGHFSCVFVFGYWNGLTEEELLAAGLSNIGIYKWEHPNLLLDTGGFLSKIPHMSCYSFV